MTHPSSIYPPASRRRRRDVGGCALLLFYWLLVLGGFVAAALCLGSCERRELYVYGDEFHSVILDVDWRQYDTRDPDGMTVWFYPLEDPGHRPYRTTSANVRHLELYLPGGLYQGVVIDYSPEEFSRQEFLGMDGVETARVHSLPASYQPDSLTVSGQGVPAGLSAEVNQQLYGDSAWTPRLTPRTPLLATGLYTVGEQPEQMALDTLDQKRIYDGEYGEYIPWKRRNDYQTSLTIQHLYSWPQPLIWQLRVRVFIREGYNYLWQTPSSLAGLADGHFLARHVNTDAPDLLTFDSWETTRTGQNEGYIATTLTTFGLRPASILPTAETHVPPIDDEDERAWWTYRTGLCLPQDLRLNLSFVLRDHATVVNFHFNVGDLVVSYDAQRVLRIDLELPGIVLPYVDPYNGTGFGADVTPWQEEDPIDVPM